MVHDTPYDVQMPLHAVGRLRNRRLSVSGEIHCNESESIGQSVHEWFHVLHRRPPAVKQEEARPVLRSRQGQVHRHRLSLNGQRDGFFLDGILILHGPHYVFVVVGRISLYITACGSSSRALPSHIRRAWRLRSALLLRCFVWRLVC